MNIQHSVILAHHTSLGVGGLAENYILAENTEDLLSALGLEGYEHTWLIGYGANSLISDQGLPGLVIHAKGGQISRQNDLVVADAGVLWDDVVEYSVREGLWGIELMSGIPGGIGAAVRINIAAYGQSVADSIEWIESYNPDTKETIRHAAKDLEWGYKQSFFQSSEGHSLIILRAAFKLRREPTKELTYTAALDYAHDHGMPTDTLAGRRSLIVGVRSDAGSMLTGAPGESKTAGSFFRNPVVTPDQAAKVIAYDESGRTADQVNKMNTSHGGDTLRVSAAHVMLASGYNRGDSWGRVGLHKDHVLKLENLGGATAQEIYDVAQEIIDICQQKTGITLEPECEILGAFL